MLIAKSTAVLLDLPTFPKGVMSLSLPRVAALFEPHFTVKVIDLNNIDYSVTRIREIIPSTDICGLKVSSQNVHIAREVSQVIRKISPHTIILWGGEYPTLKPDACREFADCVFSGLLEHTFDEFLEDYLLKRVHGKVYLAPKKGQVSIRPTPSFSVLDPKSHFFSFMGVPIETSHGCPFGCSFCMVHQMQPDGHVAHKYEELERDLAAAGENFVNVVDYNIGASKEHFLAAADLLGKSRCRGWMAETCLEALDDDQVLASLRRNRCFAIYCGLETISELGLKSIAKRQNVVADYRRIIRKVQSYGIQVASGIILALPGQTKEDLIRTTELFEDLGLLYIKLTFLTYNPGTTVYRMMSRKGTFPSADDTFFDGNHLSFLPHGVDPAEVFVGANRAINKFYSLRSLVRRSRHLALNPLRRIEFMAFSFLYSQAYRQWQRHDVLSSSAGHFESLLRESMKVGGLIRAVDRVLSFTRTLSRRPEVLRSSAASAPTHYEVDPIQNFS